jgi:hypothetical protein
MIFPYRQDLTRDWQGSVKLGALATLYLNQEFHLAGLSLIVPLTVSGIEETATAVGNGLLDAVARVTLQVNDGASQRSVVNVSGIGAILEQAYLSGRLDANTAAARNTSAGKLPGNGKYYVTYPLNFRMPQLCEPYNLCTILALPSFSAKPQLQVTFNAQSSMVESGATITLGDPFVVLDRVRVATGERFRTFRFDVQEVSKTFSAERQDTWEIPVPGAYTSILSRSFDSDGAPGGILTATGFGQFQRIGVTVKRWTEIAEVVKTSQRCTNFTPFDGVLLHDFVGEVDLGSTTLDSVLDANILIGSGARVQLLQDIATANSSQVLIMRRVIDNITPLRWYAPEAVL